MLLRKTESCRRLFQVAVAFAPGDSAGKERRQPLGSRERSSSWRRSAVRFADSKIRENPRNPRQETSILPRISRIFADRGKCGSRAVCEMGSYRRLCCFYSGFWKGRQEINEPGRVPRHWPVVEAVRPIPLVTKSNNSFLHPDRGASALRPLPGSKKSFRVPIPAVSACGLNRRLMSAIPIGMNFMPPRSRNCASTWAEQKPTETRTRIPPRNRTDCTAHPRPPTPDP